MHTQTIQSNINLETREILSPVLLAFLKQKIKELGQEKNEQIIMESIKVVADEISHKQTLNATAIREELEEKLKNELATKDFVRAEIAEAKQELKLEIAEAKQELKLEIAEAKQELKLEIAEAKLEIAEVKKEITESQKKQLWFIVSTGIISVITIVGANFALIKFLIDTFLAALSASIK